MKIEDLPYLREISIDYKHHIGGYMGGGSWAITTKRDSNGDRARIILGRGTGYKSHADNITFNIIEPNLETLELQWTFFRGVKRFPDDWRRNRHFGYNSVIYAHFQQFKGRFERPFCWDRIYLHTRLSPQIFVTNKTDLGGWDEWEKSEHIHRKHHQDIYPSERWWYRKPDMKDLYSSFEYQLQKEMNNE
tara:strand:- start:133 stop:702 length:570 start_codon:yes stop_codon:yes gene_type:complete